MSLEPIDADVIEIAMSLLCPRWTTAILIQLAYGKKRNSELLDTLSPISAKVLATRLSLLRRLGLIERTSHREVPPRVEYTLTEEGAKLIDLLKSVKTVSKKMSEEELHNWGNPLLR